VCTLFTSSTFSGAIGEIVNINKNLTRSESNEGINPQKEPRLTDPNTKFHRVYVLGAGDSNSEDASFKDDLDKLKKHLETNKNQAPGSTSRTFIKPTKEQVKGYLDQLKKNAQPGEEVTFYFGGHGNSYVIRFAKGVRVTADELAKWLTGFEESVTIVVILDTCHGGGFIDNIGESHHVAVIGTKAEAPIDAYFFLFKFITKTLTEAIEVQAGKRKADKNKDGIVTAAELKKCLEEKKWELGQPGSKDKPKNGKSKCLDCVLPSIVVNPPIVSPGTVVDILGENFAPQSWVTLSLYDTNLTPIELGEVQANYYGSFSVSLHIPSVPSMIVAIDDTGNLDWHIFSNPPNEPTQPEGPTAGFININYTYTSSTTDPDGEEVYYMWDWGDGNISDWIGPYDSGETLEASHTWTAPGEYEIKVKAIDPCDAESDWSDPLSVVIIEDNTPPTIELIQPREGYLYIFDREIIPIPLTIVIGPITIEVEAHDEESGMDRAEFYIDDELRYTDYEEPYEWLWDETVFERHTIKVIAYDNAGNSGSDEIDVIIFNI
jgi:hypothetical protein